MVLPKIYKVLYQKEVFTYEDVLKLGYSHNLAKKTLYRLNKQGYIGRIRGGNYYIIPLETRGKTYNPDRYKVGSIIVKPYFFSHHSALDIHGVAHYTSNTIYISSTKRFSSFTFKNIHFKSISTKYLFGAKKVLRGGSEIFVSDQERTFLDGLRRLDLVGGVEQFLKNIEGFPYLKSDKILDYLEKFGKKSLYQKVGFVLDYFKDTLRPPEPFLKKLASYVTTNIYYLEPSVKKGATKFVKKWNLMVSVKFFSKGA